MIVFLTLRFLLGFLSFGLGNAQTEFPSPTSSELKEIEAKIDTRRSYIFSTLGNIILISVVLFNN